VPSQSAETRPPLLLKAEELGRMLGVNKSTIWSWHSSGRIPLPVRIGGCTRWRRAEIETWVEAGCPPRARWLVIWGGTGRNA
jgi:predicted DNA-binding transcriptional regulator AlpA